MFEPGKPARDLPGGRLFFEPFGVSPHPLAGSVVLVGGFAGGTGVAVFVAGSEVSGAVVGVVKVPCLAWFDGFAASDAVGLACFDCWCEVCSGSSVCGAVASVVAVAALGFVLCVVLGAVAFGNGMRAAWLTADALGPRHYLPQLSPTVGLLSI